MAGPSVISRFEHASPLDFAEPKTLLRKRADVGEIFAAAKPIRVSSPMDGESSPSPGVDVGDRSVFGALAVLDGASALPPTPPSVSQDTLAGRALDSQQVPPTLSSRRSGLSTPTGRSPPTPDTTPPDERFLQLPAPSPFPSEAMSQAESFQTAREEQWSSDEEASDMYAYSEGRQTSTRAYMEATKALRGGDRSLEFSYEHRDGDRTPTNIRTPKHDAPTQIRNPKNPNRWVEQRDNATALNVAESASAEIWTENSMRNVTRRYDQPRTPQQPHQLDRMQGNHTIQRFSPDGISPASIRSAVSNAPPSTIDVAKMRAVSDSTYALSRGIHNAIPKRFSDVSNTSTVVEAIIRVTTPPSTERRTLRHVSKYTGLRSLSGSSINISQVSPVPAVRPNGAVVTSEDAPMRKLSHKRASIGEQRAGDGAVKETDHVVLPPVQRPLRHSRDYSHLRPDTGSSVADPVADGSLRAAQHLGTETSAPSAGQQHGHLGMAVDNDLMVPVEPPEPLPTDSNRRSFEEALPKRPKTAEDPQLVVVEGEGEPPTVFVVKSKPKPALKHRPEKLELGPPLVSQEPTSPARHQASFSSTESPSRLMPVVPPEMRGHSRTKPSYGSRSAESPLNSRAVNFEGASAPRDILDVRPRRSADNRRSLVPANEDANVSHRMSGYASLYPPVTPLSMSSMRSEAPEIIEATAVTLYPHNNESLLLIQHGLTAGFNDLPVDFYSQLNGSPVLPSELHQAIDAIDHVTPSPRPMRVVTTAETEDILNLTPPDSADEARAAPQLLIEPSTPTTIVAPTEADSPLRNPRSAPQPPAIKFIPPTPLSELSNPLDIPRQPPQAPIRRAGLMQRARRYSDSVIQPLFSRTITIRRYVTRPSTGGVGSRDRNLHPFWRPRGFWDDFSDSDSDEEFWGDGELLDIDDPVERRLPTGGDTSDVRSLEQTRGVLGRVGSMRKAVMDGFRGSGGFLIGNSLGVERAGTNSRRHHISLPSRLQARYAPNRGVATLPAHVAERYASAGAAHLNAARQQPQSHTAGSRLAPEPGFSHNTTQPLSVRSEPSRRSHSMSQSSFPSSYATSASGASVRRVPRRRKRGWRQNIQFPFRVEYVGLRGLTERMRERKAEKRRDDLRQSIGRGILQEGYTTR